MKNRMSVRRALLDILCCQDLVFSRSSAHYGEKLSALCPEQDFEIQLVLAAFDVDVVSELNCSGNCWCFGIKRIRWLRLRTRSFWCRATGINHAPDNIDCFDLLRATVDKIPEKNRLAIRMPPDARFFDIAKFHQ